MIGAKREIKELRAENERLKGILEKALNEVVRLHKELDICREVSISVK